MKRFKAVKLLALSLLLSVFAFVPIQNILAQNQVISLELEVSNSLENSQFIGLTNLGLDKDGRGPVLVSGFIQNITNERVNDLFLEVNIFAGKFGAIANVSSQQGFPFSLAPMQSIYITNNSLAENTIPGVEEVVRFDRGLTVEGDNFFDNLEGSTTLPNDIYSVEVTVYQITNENGKVALASAQAEIGGGSVSEFVDFFLRTPGDVIDANVEITNPYPQFSWEGEQGIEYRLIVVKSADIDSPESLLQSARSSAPVTDGGSLLQYENLDVYVTGESFQYPASGAQALEAGKTYFWQLSTSIRSGNAIDERTSEIWSFKLSEPETFEAPVIISEETKKALQELIGMRLYENLTNSGYTVQSLEVDGITHSGNTAAIILSQILRKIENGDIILSEGN